MEGQQSTNGNLNAETQGVSSADSNMNQLSPMPENQAPSSSTPLEQEQTETNVGDGATTSKKRKLTSDVWNHFEKKMVNGLVKAECNYCKKKLVGGSRDGTTHLRDHLKSCARRGCRDMRQQVLRMGQKKTGGQANLACLNFNPEKSRKDLAEMVIVHEYPLVMVEHHRFRKFVVGLQPLFKVPCRNMLKKYILKIYDYEKDMTMGLLAKNQSKIAITTDMWTSSNQKKGFKAITTHLVDDNWEMRSRIMRFAYMPRPHTAVNLTEVLYESLFQDGLSIIGDGIERVRDSVAFWTATPKRVEKFEEAARHLAIECSKKLALDCKTRWNSTYLMLSVALVYKNVFKRLKERDPLYKSLPTERDWELASNICGKLQVFYKVTLMLSGTKYPTANIFIESVCEIRYSLSKWSGDGDEIIKTMAEKMLVKFDKYWYVIHGVMGVAAVLDPRFKLKIMEYAFPMLYGSDKSDGITFELDHYLQEKVWKKNTELDILSWWKTNGFKYLPLHPKVHLVQVVDW
ncbi:hypothetical protein OSB04_028400 [Centaurea solstitialis]|uniref:BED-type domain-containing protein n=1 Tax=Centaurea solstitialis TaxID=347529 RepID=A0AA38W978_9ASTR|nr:hypothetical protein OSB04_028400 [Centaurea solstitialis]